VRLLTGSAFPQGERNKIEGIFLAGKSRRVLQNAHLLRYASSFGIAAYEKIRLTSQDLRALHLSIFEQPDKLFPNLDVR